MENEKNKNKGLIIAIIILVVVLVACCVAGVIIWRKKVNSATNKIVEYTEDYMKNYNNMKEVVVNNIDDEKNKLEEQKNEIVNEYSNKRNEEVNKYGTKNVLLSVSGNCRVQGLHHIRRVREEARCGGHAGSAGLCHKRAFGCYYCTASRGEAGRCGNQ